MNRRFLQQANNLLQSVHKKELLLAERIEAATSLAKLLLQASSENQTRNEKKRDAHLGRLIRSKQGKAFVSSAIDSCFRTKNPARIIDQFSFLLRRYTLPKSIIPFQRLATSLLAKVGSLAPSFFVALLQAIIKHEMSDVILPGEKKPLEKRLKALYDSGVKVNLNRLGEAILGENEAKKRFEDILEDLANPHIFAVSVKISSIYSNVSPLAWESTLSHLKERYRTLIRTSMQHAKTLYLDMEEYKDLELTAALFQEVLSEPEFRNASCGIALQSYLPDSFEVLKRLVEWAQTMDRAPIRIRLVKGANLGMEQVEASLKNWPQAPYLTKLEVDENFKKMLHFGTKHANKVHIAVASHNLFDIAYAMILREECDLASTLSFEMLAGMAPHIARTVHLLSKDLLLYCPAARKEEFHTAMAYLMRRLDENTAPDNFLTHLFDLKANDKAWKAQEQLFLHSCLYCEDVDTRSHRNQNRQKLELELAYNVPDTDWSLSQNRAWGKECIQKWKSAFHEIPLVIDGNEYVKERQAKGFDPSQPGKVIHTYSLASERDIKTALSTACKEAYRWKTTSLQERIFLLREVAYSLQRTRADLIGAMMQESAKPIAEADSEVSEAIDFAFYYATQLEMEHLGQKSFQTGKVALVATPWNFPCAIPLSAIVSSIATGHSVIFKPAPEAALVGWQLVQALWKAGVPKRLVQFVTCEDEPTGSLLINDPRIDKVILTGATSTARLFLQMRPALKLFGETGGKNAIIVTSLSDRDLAVRDIIHSSFGYAGQKCSACSLAILEEEVYYDRLFREQLRDAACSRIVGSAWNLETQVPPLIKEASPHLLQALTTCEEGEEWLVQPVQDAYTKNLWSCGIKYGVQPHSFMHQTEFFGPVLAVMCARNLEHALTLANSTPYGLTAGLHSLDPREQKLWQEKIEAGNCYINRGITGAIVGRQPFGGCKASSFGIGMKVGGPNYLLQFLDSDTLVGNEAVDCAHPYEEACCRLLNTTDKKKFLAATHSYAMWWQQYFSRTHTLKTLTGQDNTLSFRPKSPYIVLFHDNDPLLDCLLILSSCLITGCKALFGAEEKMRALFAPIIDVVPYDEALQAIPKDAYVRTLQLPKEPLCTSCIDTAPPCRHGRVELIHYVREISLSHDWHRYGNLMGREGVQVPW